MATSAAIEARTEELIQRDVIAELKWDEVQGAKVVLKGTVRSWAERKEAERVAWSAPGVAQVENRLMVSF
jgi:hypothetical protein